MGGGASALAALHASTAGTDVTDKRTEFERLVMPHAAAAYGLARWMLRHPQDAEDAVQDAILRAFRSFDQHTGGSGKAWLLAIVRNVALTRLGRARTHGKVVVLQDVLDGKEQDASLALADPAPGPEAELSAKDDRQRVWQALAQLPQTYREVIILREFDDLSYQEIAEVIGVPTGTVMSRLGRARERLRQLLAPAGRTERAGGRKADHD